ncbi:hypothetical protein [Crenobacter intestini]|uniref:Uncharacterized protein n=1 Tax=Crenobacter intestini TaxID=2563443 RepID=A0A4T0UIQ4_9NEIS|nr:hypothetical protein [Crenobacter intestini]TIC78424.1 hypothetical protein E5K04_16405 [Crenobacter intestini]
MLKLLVGLALLLAVVGLVSWRRRAKYRLRHYTYPHHIEMTPEEEEQFKRESEAFGEFRRCEVHRTFPRPSDIPEVKVGDVRKRYE